VNFSQPIRDNVNESISGQFGQIAVKVYGDDLVALQKTAEAIKGAIGKVPGVADLGIVKSGEVPQVQVEADRMWLARNGISLRDFQHVFQTAMGGRKVDEFWDGERRFDIVLRLPLHDRDEIGKIRKLRVPTDDGLAVPLDALARVKFGFGRASISRENGRRYIGIRMNVRGRDLGGFVSEARARVQREVPLGEGMTVEWGGEFENKERAMNRLLTVIPVALLLTLILLFKAFDSMTHAVLTLINVPFALVGGVMGLWLTGMPVSIAAAVGFIALIGQASLNGVLVMSGIAGGPATTTTEALDEAIVRGCRERLRPVLMTAALAALGLIPAALSHGIGSETQRPLAVVIVFGTLSACGFTLVLLPVVYRLYAQRRMRA
jgi:cobalt-zinc-cadmium resistance protein CzcA